MLRDLDAVVDHAAIETFALLGYCSSAVTAIAYAARHPERVTPSHTLDCADAVAQSERDTMTSH